MFVLIWRSTKASSMSVRVTLTLGVVFFFDLLRLLLASSTVPSAALRKTLCCLVFKVLKKEKK